MRCLQDYEVDDLIDVIEGSRVYIPWCATPRGHLAAT